MTCYCGSYQSWNFHLIFTVNSTREFWKISSRLHKPIECIQFDTNHKNSLHSQRREKYFWTLLCKFFWFVQESHPRENEIKFLHNFHFFCCFAVSFREAYTIRLCKERDKSEERYRKLNCCFVVEMTGKVVIVENFTYVNKCLIQRWVKSFEWRKFIRTILSLNWRHGKLLFHALQSLAKLIDHSSNASYCRVCITNY